MLNVLLTVDTEVWPRVRHRLSAQQLRQTLERDIYGITSQGEYGIAYQIKLLNKYGLKGVFLIEALFATLEGIEPLSEIIALVQGQQQEAQLHLHPEWLRKIQDPRLPPFREMLLHRYSLEDQCRMFDVALENFRQAGGQKVTGFRAGGFAANLDTLRALRRFGITFDCSYNLPMMGVTCEIRLDRPLPGPAMVEGVCEVPVTFFEDWPGHYRPLQICACSSSEIEHVLTSAYRRGLFSAVIVSHSFELIKRSTQLGQPSAVSSLAVARFERLCEFLDKNRDKFRTVGFNDISPDQATADEGAPILKSNMLRTAGRFAQQLAGRFI